LITVKSSTDSSVFVVNSVVSAPAFRARGSDFLPSAAGRRAACLFVPVVDEGGITILAGNFNTNLDPYGNRISQSSPSSDPTRKLLLDLTTEYIDTALAIACAKAFITR
ncbi:13234_t:CDS:2, partial [Gigaspora rosea]